MTPDRGGPSLPDAPTCGAGDLHSAHAYLLVLEAALDQDGWSQGQRREIRRRMLKWKVRALGVDDYYNRRGNIPGSPDGPPPTQAEITVTRWHRAHRAQLRTHAKAMSAKEKLKAEEVKEDKEHE
jgi:hypothetical protein